MHYTKACARYADNWCGKWGEGKLITLHELHPDIFPEGVRRAFELRNLIPGGCHMGFGDFK